MFHLVFYAPEIPGNTGNAIRLAAVTGAVLHLIEPLGFDLTDAKLRRAGLDYHDLACVRTHPTFETALVALHPARIFAFTGMGETRYTNLTYRPGDALLFGPESVGLPPHILKDVRLETRVSIPMLPGRRSLNLTSSASIVLYEALRQQDFLGMDTPSFSARSR